MPSEDNRVVVRDFGFEGTLLQLMRGRWDLAEPYIRAAEIVLAENPSIGTPMGNGVWSLPMSPVDDQDVCLYYTFFESVVLLLEITVE